jgi:plasmid stabilization system protein ParE
MRLSFRTQARLDLRWFAYYYADRFPEGRKKAEQSFRATIKLVLGNPYARQRLEGVDARRLPVTRTPFVLVYTVVGDRIDVIRVWDARSDPRDLIPQ